MSYYDEKVLDQLTRIADALEKIEKKLPEKPIRRQEYNADYEIDKTCSNCFYESLTYDEYPCCFCGLDHCMWEPAKVEEGEKETDEPVIRTCRTCKNKDEFKHLPPCSSCKDHSNWEDPYEQHN